MTSEEFCVAVEKLIREAKEAGLDDDEIVAELEGIIAGINEE